MDNQIMTGDGEVQSRGLRIDETKGLRRDVLREDDESLWMI
jgi:hypothetical protein